MLATSVAAISASAEAAGADSGRVLLGAVDGGGHVYVEVGERAIDGTRVRVYKTRFRNVPLRCSDGSARTTNFGATELIRHHSKLRRKLSSGADGKGAASKYGWEYQGVLKRWGRAAGTLHAYEVDLATRRRVVCRSGSLAWSATLRP